MLHQTFINDISYLLSSCSFVGFIYKCQEIHYSYIITTAKGGILTHASSLQQWLKISIWHTKPVFRIVYSRRITHGCWHNREIAVHRSRRTSNYTLVNFIMNVLLVCLTVILEFLATTKLRRILLSPGSLTPSSSLYTF